jgi:hypothetical protein
MKTEMYLFSQFQWSENALLARMEYSLNWHMANVTEIRPSGLENYYISRNLFSTSDLLIKCKQNADIL